MLGRFDCLVKTQRRDGRSAVTRRDFCPVSFPLWRGDAPKQRLTAAIFLIVLR